jgi:curli biogenesis system outer membrane secretion channel CsgG
MKRNFVFGACIVLLVLTTGIAIGKDFKKDSKDGPMAAIMDFENKTEWWGWRLGRACSDVLATELVKGTSLRCMEREKLDLVMKEKNLAASGLTTPDTYVKMGGILGVQYIVTGAVSSFGEKQFSGSGFSIGGSIKMYEATIDVRIVDTKTGEIVFADSASGSKKGLNLRVKGVGGGEDYDEQAASKLLRVACEDMAKKIQAKLQ